MARKDYEILSINRPVHSSIAVEEKSNNQVSQSNTPIMLDSKNTSQLFLKAINEMPEDEAEQEAVNPFV